MLLNSIKNYPSLLLANTIIRQTLLRLKTPQAPHSTWNLNKQFNDVICNESLMAQSIQSSNLPEQKVLIVIRPSPSSTLLETISVTFPPSKSKASASHIPNI